MKLLVLSLALALLFTAGSALQCHHCVPIRRGGKCVPSVVQCAQTDACVTIRSQTEQYQKCMARSHCLKMQGISQHHISCCYRNMCNA